MSGEGDEAPELYFSRSDWRVEVVSSEHPNEHDDGVTTMVDGYRLVPAPESVFDKRITPSAAALAELRGPNPPIAKIDRDLLVERRPAPPSSTPEANLDD